MGFSDASNGKELACNAGDLGSVPGREELLEECTATHSRILAWRIPIDSGAWQATVHVVAKSLT